MKLDEYRDEVIQKLTRVDTRQEEMIYRIGRIEKHLEKLTGQVEENKNDLTMIRTVGSVGILVMPVIVSIIMRLI